jgi:hypothetical protein
VTVQRIRFNRSMFSAPLVETDLDALIAQLAAEDIELVIDVRSTAQTADRLEALCEQAAMYFLDEPALAGDAGEEVVGWAAGLALRHRACVVGDADEPRLWAADRMAHAAGLRLIDLATLPAPVTPRLPH